LRRENLSEGQASFSPVRVIISSFAMLPPRDWDGRSIKGGGGKGNEEDRAMILTSQMMLAHESIVDSIFVASYNQNRGGQIPRAEEG